MLSISSATWFLNIVLGIWRASSEFLDLMFGSKGQALRV